MRKIHLFFFIFLLFLGCVPKPTVSVTKYISANGPIPLVDSVSRLIDENGNDRNGQFDIRKTSSNQMLAFPFAPIESDLFELVDPKHAEKNSPHHFIPRNACVLFLKHYDWGDGINVICPNHTHKLLTAESIPIEDYSASFSGDSIYYSSKNSMSGHDIWRMNRDGTDKQLIIECGEWICSAPVSSPGEESFIFIKKKNDLIKTMYYEEKNKQPEEVEQIQTTFFSEIEWSWSGRYISFINQDGQLQIFDFDNKKLLPLDIPEESSGTWAQYSDQILISYPIFWGGIPNMQVDLIDLNTNVKTKIAGGGTEPVNFGKPFYFAPRHISIMPFHLQTGGHSMQLCMVTQNSVCQSITSEQNYSYSGFGFDPVGEYFLYQRIEIGMSDAVPQIGIVSVTNYGKSELLIEGRKPIWLP